MTDKIFIYSKDREKCWLAKGALSRKGIDATSPFETCNPGRDLLECSKLYIPEREKFIKLSKEDKEKLVNNEIVIEALIRERLKKFKEGDVVKIKGSCGKFIVKDYIHLLYYEFLVTVTDISGNYLTFPENDLELSMSFPLDYD